MHIVLLKFGGNKARAGELMEAHQSWVKRGFDDEVFVMAGSLEPDGGGAILAHKASRPELERRVKEDPFVQEGVVQAEILTIDPSRTDERLGFLAS